MNRQEHRALRAIEKNIKVDDPELAELLQSFGEDVRKPIHRYAGWLAVPLLLVGTSVGDVVLLLAGLLLALWALVTWLVQAAR